MFRRSRTAQREVGQTAPTLRGFMAIDRRKSARRRRFSLKSARSLPARATPFIFSAKDTPSHDPVRVSNSTPTITSVQVAIRTTLSREYLVGLQMRKGEGV
jgi:hypothetical protein